MLLLFTLTTCFALASTFPTHGYYNDSKRAVYTLSNNPDGNNILSMSVAYNGTLSSPVLTPTGGKGLRGVYVGLPYGTAGSPANTDSLFSQGSVVVSEKVCLCP